jgi:molybdopterin-containing oxidoreductase family membrane subunit
MSDIPLSEKIPAPLIGEPARRLFPTDPAMLPGLTIATITDRIAAIPLRHRGFIWWYALVLFFTIWVGGLAVGVIWTFYRGVGMYGLSWPVMWGFDIINYVWWIGIACGCAFISAAFYLIDADWRAGIGRIADICAVTAAACGGIFPIIHLGRPWLFYWLFPYPNTMGYWPNWRSPLLWDFWGILSFVAVVAVWALIGLIPDLAVLRDRATTRFRGTLYGVAAFGFRGSGAQWRRHDAIVRALAILMLLAAIDTHSIAALDFAGGLTPGWHTTQMPPYFVFGAVLSGAAMILLVSLPLRRLLRFTHLITGRHVDMLCKIMICSSLLVTYSYGMEAFMSWYSGLKSERAMFADRVMGPYAYIYWGTIAFNCLLPQLFWIRRLRFVQPLVWLVSFLVLVGMWMDPCKIVLGSLFRPHLPSAWGLFHVQWDDLITLLGSIGLFCMVLLIMIRILPMAPIGQLRRLLTRVASS